MSSCSWTAFQGCCSNPPPLTAHPDASTLRPEHGRFITLNILHLCCLIHGRESSFEKHKCVYKSIMQTITSLVTSISSCILILWVIILVTLVLSYPCLHEENINDYTQQHLPKHRVMDCRRYDHLCLCDFTGQEGSRKWLSSTLFGFSLLSLLFPSCCPWE